MLSLEKQTRNAEYCFRIFFLEFKFFWVRKSWHLKNVLPISSTHIPMLLPGISTRLFLAIHFHIWFKSKAVKLAVFNKTCLAFSAELEGTEQQASKQLMLQSFPAEGGLPRASLIAFSEV